MTGKDVALVLAAGARDMRRARASIARVVVMTLGALRSFSMGRGGRARGSMCVLDNENGRLLLLLISNIKSYKSAVDAPMPPHLHTVSTHVHTNTTRTHRRLEPD